MDERAAAELAPTEYCMSNFSRDRSLSALVLCSVLLLALAACDAQKPPYADAGSSGRSGSKPGTGSGSGDPPVGGPNESDAAVDDAGSVANSSAVPEFEGLPLAGVPYGMPPQGCTEGSSGDELVLQLDTQIKSLLLTAANGVLQANGIACTSVKAPKSVKILGTAAADTVIIDFSQEPFPSSLLSGTISIDPSTGSAKDTVAVAFTVGADDVHLGTMKTTTLIGAGKAFPRVSVVNQEVTIVSTGPGEDTIDATGGGEFGAPLLAGVTMYGGADADVMQGGIGSDVLHGGSGDDLFKTAAAKDGGDVYDGGDDEDTLSYELRVSPVTVRVDRVANDGDTNENDDVQNTVEVLIGGKGADTIVGGDADNVLIGGPGNDTLSGGAGDDWFVESAAAAGSDIMNGGDGSDTIDYGERADDLDVSLCVANLVTCTTGACGCAADDGSSGEKDTLVGIENAITGSGDDTLVGSAADNLLRGGPGNDVVRGEAGNDYIYGEEGNDALYGGDGDDLLDGGPGNDSLDAGGGEGDICVYTKVETAISCEL